MKVHLNYSPYNCDYRKVYAAPDGYHYKGTRYDTLSEVREVYKSDRAVNWFFTSLTVLILGTCIICAGIIILSGFGLI